MLVTKSTIKFVHTSQDFEVDGISQFSMYIHFFQLKSSKDFGEGMTLKMVNKTVEAHL